jgi:hypothetical protein
VFRTGPGTWIDPLIAEVLTEASLVRDDNGEAIAGNLFEAHLRAAVLRGRLTTPDLPDAEEGEVFDAWVDLAERMEARCMLPARLAVVPVRSSSSRL